MNDSLLRSATGYLGLKVVGAAIGFVNGILIARLLGPKEFGAYAVLMSLVGMAMTLALLGSPTLLTRETASASARGEWPALKGLLRSAGRVLILSSALVAGAFLLIGGSRWPDADSAWLLMAVCAALVPVCVSIHFRAAILRGFNAVVLADLPELGLRPLLMLVVLLAAWASSMAMGAGQVLALQLATASAAMLAGMVFLARRQPAAFRSATAVPPPGRWMVAAVPFLGIAGVSVLESQLSLYLLGWMSGFSETGLFQVANQLVAVVVMGLVAANIPLQPRLAAAWARGDKVEAQRLLTQTAGIGAAIALPGILILLLFTSQVLALYGEPYAGSLWALRILALGQLVNAACGSCGILLLMTGHQKVFLVGQTCAAVVNLAIALIAIPRFGAAGAAMAVAASTICWNLFFAGYAAKYLSMNTTLLTLRWFRPGPNGDAPT